MIKAVSRLPNNLRQEFYKDTGNLQFTSHNINLVFFEQWLDKKLRRYFNPIADIIANNDKVSKGNDKSTDSRRINTVTNQEKEKSSNENNNKNYKFSSGGSQVNKSLPGTQSSKQFNQSSSGNQTSKQGGKSSPSGTQNSQVNQPQNLQANQPSSGSQISQVSQPSNNPSQSTYKRKCWLCSENHRLMECEQFTSKSVADRILISQQQHLCYNCLSKGHSFDECQSTHTCKVDGCGKKHHTLLHIDKSSQKQSNTHYSSNQNHKTYLQVLPVIVSNGENFITTNALLDTGSDSTLIRQDVADKLRLSGMDQSLELSNVMSISKKMKSKLVKFNLSSSSHPNEVEISNAWVVPDLNLPVAQVNISELKENLPHLHNIDFPLPNKNDVTILIGADMPQLLIHHDFKVGLPNEPVAVKTQLGWVLMGGKSAVNKSLNNFLHSDLDILSKTVEQFWSIESYGTKFKDEVLLPKDEQRAINILETTCTKKDRREICNYGRHSTNVSPN